MGKITLVGTAHLEHGPVKRLMLPESEARFNERIMPKLTTTSFLLVEGRAPQADIFPGNPLYQGRLAEVSRELSSSEKKPVLAFADPRFSNPVHYKKGYNAFETVRRFGSLCVICDQKPQSFSEMMELIRTGNISVQMAVEPDHAVRSAAKRLAKVTQDVDDAFISKLKAAQAKYTDCYLIAGAAHCMSISVRTDWDLEIMDIDEPAIATLIFRGYIAIYEIPRILKNKG